MRVLIILKSSPTHRYLINIFAKALIDELKGLIEDKKHSQALVFAFSKGIVEREVFDEELPTIVVDLILSENSARWDLMNS